MSGPRPDPMRKPPELGRLDRQQASQQKLLVSWNFFTLSYLKLAPVVKLPDNAMKISPKLKIDLQMILTPVQVLGIKLRF